MSLYTNMNQNNMNKKSLKKLGKSDLIKLLLKQQNTIQVVPKKQSTPKIQIVDEQPHRPKKYPVSAPRKSIKQLVEQTKQDIILCGSLSCGFKCLT